MKGITLPTLLFIVFLVLKLTRLISWSWWWVTCPLWGCGALAVLAILVGVTIHVGKALCRVNRVEEEG